MFSYIKGVVTEKYENCLSLENNGIGYKIHTSLNTLQNVEKGKTYQIHTFVYVREDILDIYGFSEAEEVNMFLKLISISGVGPKAALSILSALTPSKFALAVITNDTKSITMAQGVGVKLAGRIILELKDKMKKDEIKLDGEMLYNEDFSSSDKLNEAVNALMVLGYNRQDAVMSLKGLEFTTTEEAIKYALKKR